MQHEGKTCRKCGETKPLDGFYVDRTVPTKSGEAYVRPDCKECVKRRVYAQRENNIDEYRRRERERQALVPRERKRARSRKHYAANRRKVIDYQLNRFYLKRASGVDISREEVFERDGGKCRICGCDLRRLAVWHLDHIVPIALGGTHTWENVQATCAPCNVRKNARLEGQIALPVG